MASLNEQIAALVAEIQTLGQAIRALVGMPEAQRALEQQLAEKERQLRRLTRQVEGRPAGDTVFGNQTKINTGSGDIVYGDKFSGDKVYGDKVFGSKQTITGPQIYGPINANRDINIGTEQTIINNEPPPTPPVAPTPTLDPGPSLRLSLTDGQGQPLETLTVGVEARLSVLLDGSAEYLSTLDLQLEADGGAVDWPEGSRRDLVLRPSATPRLPRWTLVPEQVGSLTLRVLAFAGDRLVQHLALTATCRDPHTPGVLSGGATAPQPVQVTVPVGLALSEVASLPPQPDALTLMFEQAPDGYRLLAMERGTVTRCTLAITDQELASLVARMRTELRAIVYEVYEGQKTYLNALAIPQSVAEHTLVRLAQLGATFWQSLFTGPSLDTQTFSARLRARSREHPLHLTITSDRLALPWHLLYDRDPSDPITPDGFWGVRHVLTTLLTTGQQLPPNSGLPELPSARTAIVGFNQSLQNPMPGGSQTLDSQRATLQELGFAVTEVTTEKALREALTQNTDAALVYLYCHCVDAAPDMQPSKPRAALPGVGSTRLILTNEGHALTLDTLRQSLPPYPAPAPLRGRPLVVLNACASAVQSPLAYAGLAPLFFDLGAQALVGTMSEVPAFFGAAFGAALLQNLVAQQQPIGAALRATTRQFLQQHQNALGLLYQLYGHADLRLVVQES